MILLLALNTLMFLKLKRAIRTYGIIGCARTALQGRLRIYPQIRESLASRAGLEIGGPSRVFRTILPLYRDLRSLDNCVYSADTVWAKQSQEFQFGSGRTGKNFFREGSDLSGLGSYDVILSSHNLEHMANPVKTLYEWQRVAPYLLIVLPHYRYTFDHRRSTTPLEHMLEDYQRDVGEDDATHMEEILSLTDLGRSPEPVTEEECAAKIKDNLRLRQLHHHVFDESNSRQLLEAVGYKVLASEFAYPVHIVHFAKANAPST